MGVVRAATRAVLAQAGVPLAVAREVAETAAVGLLQPVGCSERGADALVRVLTPGAGAPGLPRHRTPVVLVHGFCGSRTHWLPLQRRLRRAGFSAVTAVGYLPTAGVPDLAAALSRECRRVAEQAGTDSVRLVGHSLGGLVVRYAVQVLDLPVRVERAVTVAAPHRGTPWAGCGLGELAASLRPGSDLLEELGRRPVPAGVRWTSCYGGLDLVVPPASARLDAPGFDADHVFVPRAGHLGLLRAPQVLEAVVGSLLQDEVARRRPEPVVAPLALVRRAA